MNVLFVTLHYLQGNGGGVFASRAYINAFAELSTSITLLFPLKKGMEPEHISSEVSMTPVYSRQPKWLKLLNIYRGKVHRYYDVFEKELQKNKYDIVVFDNSKVSFGLIAIAHKYDTKVITIHHNYEYEYNRDNASLLTKYISLYWTKRYECEAVNNSNLNLVLTKQDADLLQRNYVHRKNSLFEVLGTFEYERNNKDANVFSSPLPDKHYRFIITGNLGGIQTENSLLSWLDNYFPILLRKKPQLHLIIAGKSPSKKLKQMCNKYEEIELISSPNSMESLLKNADFYICPVSLGGGVKLRVMDGLKEGLPILTHSVSARGYDVFKDFGCLFEYHDKISFEKSLNSLVQCSKKKEHVIKLYKEYFSFDSGLERLNKILRKNKFL